MIQYQARNDAIEGSTYERELCERCLDPCDRRFGETCPPCAGKHALGKIHPNDRDSRSIQYAYIPTGAASEIQQPTAGKDLDHGEQEWLIEQRARISIIIFSGPLVVGVCRSQPLKGTDISFHAAVTSLNNCILYHVASPCSGFLSATFDEMFEWRQSWY